MDSTTLPFALELPTDFRTARSVDNAHGRLEERVITVSSMLKDYSRWPYLEHVFKLERIVTNRRGNRTREVRSGVTSLPPDVANAARLLTIVRAEWGIENGLHDRRDVSLHEDSSRMRRGDAPQVLAALNNAVIGIVAQHGVPNLAKAQREFQYRIERVLARSARPAT